MRLLPALVLAAIVLSPIVLATEEPLAESGPATEAPQAADLGAWTLLPPLLAIVMALAFRQVVPALLAGIWVAAWMVFGGPFVGVLRMLDHYLVGSLYNRDHVFIVLFTLMLGGMVGIVSRSGGTLGLVEALRPYATNTRRGQLVTWLLGILVFFDDYANTLLVGHSMRPVTDRLRVSREKLAYIVDSTAAPVAAIGLVSTWIGYEVSLVGGALKTVGSDHDAYAIFLQAIPYNFYPIFALLFGLFIASSLRDFGPMLRAERRARGGKVLDDRAVPLSDFDNETLRAVEGRPPRWFNALVPILLVLIVTFGALWTTGRASLVADGSAYGETPFFALGLQGLGSVFGAGDSYSALLWASFTGGVAALLLAVGQRILSLGQALEAWLGGMKSMWMAMVILVLAWAIGDACTELDIAGYLASVVGGTLDPAFLPMLIFVLAALIAFATGTSWATMSILIPISVPLAVSLTEAGGYGEAAAHRVLLGAVSAVLAGAIFGDHCSPISDTTVLSSMSSGCDHVDHVRTQLPYAALVAFVVVVCGYLPNAFGLPAPICLLLGAGVLSGAVFVLGRPVGEATKPS